MRRPVKILFVIPQLTVGGAEKMLCQLVTSFDRSKIEPAVWNLGNPGKFSDPIREAGVPLVERQPLGRGKYLFLDALRFPNFIRRGGFDMVHSFMFGPHWVDAILAGMVPGVQYLVARLEVQLWREGDARLGWGERARNRLVTHAIANSQAVKEVVTGVEGYEDERVSVIYNGVDLADFPPGGQSARSGPFRIGNVATLKEIKSQMTILQALDILVNERGIGDVEVVFTGRSDGGYEEKMQEYAAEKGLTPHIRSLGEIPNVYEELREFDVMALPSLAEGFSVAVVESLAAGVPVVASRVGGNPEIVIPGETGDLFDVGDYRALADILYRLYSHRDWLAELGVGARRLVESRFRQSIMVKNYEDLYIELAGRRDAAG